jgi:hypothetical protein
MNTMDVVKLLEIAIDFKLYKCYRRAKNAAVNF